MNIETDIVKTSKKYNNRNLVGEKRILDICHKEKADVYINPIGGKDLYTKDVFESDNVRLQFIDMEQIEYKQYSNEFVPNLSIIDTLMFNNKEKLSEYLNKYNLI